MRSAKHIFIFALVAAMLWLVDTTVQNDSSKRNVAIRPVADTETIATSTPPGFVPVTHVADGDTIVVAIEGVTTTVRLIGIDTPETTKPHTPVQCFGPEASAEVKKLLIGKSVRLEEDISQGHLDKYGRTLAYIFLQDGTLLEQYLIENGFGREYTYHHSAYKYQSVLKKAQSDAQAAKKGLWSPATCNGTTQTTASTPGPQ